MLLTDRLTVGEITFILRLIIQVLNYAGIFILGLIILTNAPRIAAIVTHDVLNRIVGKITSTYSSIKWCLSSITRRGPGPKTPTSHALLLSVIFFTIYSAFTALSDVGLLGFHTCTTPYSPYWDFPSSINSDQAADKAIASTLVNGTLPSNVQVFRCDSPTLTSGPNVAEYVCDSWQNSTLTDKDFWKGLNFTDSAALSNTLLRPINFTEPTDPYLNSFYIGTGNTKTRNPTIEGGILVEPHATGARAVIGVPNLPPEKSITINQTMLIEVDFGCTDLGLFTRMNLDDSFDDRFDTFATHWEESYTGPEVLREIVANYSGVVRNLVRPMFNESSLDDNGYLYPGNWTNASSMTPLPGLISPTAQIMNIFIMSGSENLPGEPVNFTAPSSIYDTQYNVTMGCTADVYKALNVTLLSQKANWITDYQCGMFAITGSFIEDGISYAGLSRYFCAAATQINMASATIVTDANGAISVDYTRLPSDLYHTVAGDGLDTYFDNVTNKYFYFTPYDRYTLSFNPDTGSAQHYIGQYLSLLAGRPQGLASAGNVLSTLSSSVISWDYINDNSGMAILEDGTNYINFNASVIPAWSGKFVGALMRSSLVYNGYAAQQAREILITSTGGRPAICYDLRYGAAFMPLLIGALIAIGWSAILAMTTAFKGARMAQNLYGGVAPLRIRLCPKWALKDTILVWQSSPEPHLEAVMIGGGGDDGNVGVGGGLEAMDASKKTRSGSETAVSYLCQRVDGEAKEGNEDGGH
jgi:hypothetical protein